VKRGRDDREIDEFRFGCDACKREYVYADGQLSERRKERDTYAESAAIARSETEAALKHRCPACGGPISDGRVGSMFCCLWCGEKYGVETGELVPKPSEALLPQSKPKMSDFYALQPNR
jgi:nitrite reductase/ring-hydroxylating ferredoxin subunit